MKTAFFAVSLCLAGTSCAAAGNAQSSSIDSAANTPVERTVESLIRDACDAQQTVVKTTKRTTPKYFAGRMVPRTIESKETVCN